MVNKLLQIGKMTKKLTYFDLNGLAEGIRYILHYNGQKFEDVRHDLRTWPIKEVKDNLPFGKLPILEEGEGRRLHQSLAIARYLAANTDLLPSDPWEQALLDAAVLTLYDLDNHFGNYEEATGATKAELKKKFYEVHLVFYLSRFEKQLSQNNGHFGKKLSWADFAFVGFIECYNLFLNDNVEKNYPTIAALMKEVQNLPGVKDYIQNRKPYDISFLNP